MQLETYIDTQIKSYDSSIAKNEIAEGKDILLEITDSVGECKYDRRKYRKLEDLFSLVRKYLENHNLGRNQVDLLSAIIRSFRFLSNTKGYNMIKRDLEKTLFI